MKIVSAQETRVDIQLTPLIDMVFILLVFVVLVANFARPKGIQVTPPAAQSSAVTEAKVAVISITKDGTLRDGERVVEDADLRSVLVGLKGKYSTLLIRADGSVALDRAVRVLDTARLAGFESISMATRETAGP